MLRSNPSIHVAIAAALCCAASFAQLPPAAHPEDAGFSSKRLETTRAVLKADVDAKRLPGAVLLIARNGKGAFYDALGYQDRASAAPLNDDSGFPALRSRKHIPR